MARTKKIKLPNKYERDINGVITRVENGEDLENLLRPYDIIVDSRGNRIRCNHSIFLNGKEIYTFNRIVELYTPDKNGQYIQIAAYSKKTRKLELL